MADLRQCAARDGRGSPAYRATAPGRSPTASGPAEGHGIRCLTADVAGDSVRPTLAKAVGACRARPAAPFPGMRGPSGECLEPIARNRFDWFDRMLRLGNATVNEA
jgi:hypothetical protein